MAVALRFGSREARKLTRQGGDSRRKGADEGFVCGCAQTVVVIAACIGFARFILLTSPLSGGERGVVGLRGLRERGAAARGLKSRFLGSWHVVLLDPIGHKAGPCSRAFSGLLGPTENLFTLFRRKQLFS